MSSELKVILSKVVEEEYKNQKSEIEQESNRFESILLKLAKTKSFTRPVWVQGSRIRNSEKYEKDLNLLERANLIKVQKKFTDHNAYSVYQLTPTGTELAKKLLQEP